MNIPHAATLNKTKVGTCPHGLPQGACPICNGMGGGGGAGIRKTDKPEKEMSWSECYVVWQQMLKAKNNNTKQTQNEAIQAQMISQYRLQLSLGNMANKLANFTEKLSVFSQKPQNNSSFSSKILAFSAKLSMPILNSLKNVLSFADKAINSIRGKLTDISDKLNAIFGELKNAIEKKISDKFKDFKKKIKSFFGIFEPAEVVDNSDEEKQIDEEKRLFEMNTILDLIKEKFNNNEIKEFKDGVDSYSN